MDFLGKHVSKVAHDLKQVPSLLSAAIGDVDQAIKNDEPERISGAVEGVKSVGRILRAAFESTKEALRKG